MLNIFKGRKVDTATQPMSYRSAGMSECQTVEGARALASKLRSRADVLTDGSFSARVKLKQQADVCDHAARNLALSEEMLVRIPAACKRDEAAAALAVQTAEKDRRLIEKRIEIAKERIARFTESAQTKRKACDEVAAAAASKLGEAEAALHKARDLEDAGAMARASAVVMLERQNVAAARERNGAALLEANSFDELVDKARGELVAAQEEMFAANQRLNESRSAVLALEADQHALEALVAHLRWRAAKRVFDDTSYTPFINNAAFFFHKGERALRWDGKPGARLINDFGGLGGLLDSFREPDWVQFDVDPLAAGLDGELQPAEQ